MNEPAKNIPPDPMQLPYLPECLIFQILLRSPVKSLLRFKCVSKKWFSLISSSNFIKTHLKIASEDKLLEHHRVLQVPPQSSKTVGTFSLHVSPNGTSNRVDFDIPFQRRFETTSCLDSFNGLVCLHLKSPIVNAIILWNPSTRKLIKELPNPYSTSTSCGFGYDESSDDYILVFFTGYHILLPNQTYKILSEVYSLKKNSSQKSFSEYATGTLCRGKKSVYCSGFFHCLAKEGVEADEPTRTRYIASFDPVAGTYDSIPMPNFDSSNNSSPTLMRLGECLALVKHHSEEITDVYIIKDYAEKQWTKLISIPILKITCPRTPVFWFENGMILCRSLRVMDLYNGRGYVLQNFEPHWERDLTVYVESLISPDSGADAASSS